MAATYAAFMRRLSRDQSSNHSGGSNNDEPTDESELDDSLSKKISGLSFGGPSSSPTTPAVHPHRHHSSKHGPPPSSSRSRAFLAGLVNSSKRRFSLPVNDGDNEPLPPIIQSARHASADQGRPKLRNGSTPDFLEVNKGGE
jgi:hypothetical protein